MAVQYVEKVFDITVKAEQANGFKAPPRAWLKWVTFWRRPNPSAAFEWDEENPPPDRLSDKGESVALGQRSLRCIAGLLGETEPEVVPVASTWSSDEQRHVYRFDWIFGVTVPPRDAHRYPEQQQVNWDWMGSLRNQNSFVIQLLISPGNHGFGFTELSTDLIALHPSKDTRSWLEIHREQLNKSLTDVGTLAKGVGPAGGAVGAATGTAVATLLQTASVLTNFVDSRNGGRKNWYIYRYLDAEASCCAIEWRIHKPVLLEYGPLLRGSVLLAFHGSPNAASADAGEGMKIMLKANLGFRPRDLLKHLGVTRALREEEQPRLLIRPRIS